MPLALRPASRRLPVEVMARELPAVMEPMARSWEEEKKELPAWLLEWRDATSLVVMRSG